MSASKALAAARAELRTAEQALAAYDAERAKVNANVAKSRKRLAAEVKRQPAMVALLANDYHLVNLAQAHAGYGAPQEEKELLASLRAGKTKVSLDHGGEYSVKGLSQRLRVVSKQHQASFARAQEKVRKARLAWEKATTEFEALRKEAHEAGTPVSFEEVVTTVAKCHVLNRGSRLIEPGGDWRRQDLVRRVEAATVHAEAMKSRIDCPCGPCVRARKAKEDAEREKQRLAALPKLTFTCPDHGKRRGPLDRIRRWDNATARWQDNVPVVICPVDAKQFIHSPTLAKEAALAAKTAKAAAKAEKAAGVKKGQELDYTCPDCGEEGTGTVEVDDYDGALFIECESCEASIRVVAQKGKAA